MQDWPALSYNQGTMSFDQYRQDPDGFRQHYQQPKKPNYTGWIIGCCVVPTVIGIGIAIWGAVWTARTLSGQNSFMSSMLPRAGVTTGTQLAWQEPLGRSHMLSPHMVCGDFDGDGAEEILLPGRRMPQPSLLRTHPPSEQRIARLMALAGMERAGPALPRQPVAPRWPVVTAPPRFRRSGLWY